MEREDLQRIMNTAWGFVRRNGYTLSQALKQAWATFRLSARLHAGIVHFYFRKVDGTIREAWGTLASNIIPATKGTDSRKSLTGALGAEGRVLQWSCHKWSSEGRDSAPEDGAKARECSFSEAN